MAFTHQHINAYVIVGGDSDFLSLVEKLKQYDKKVFVVGGRAFTSIILQRNCHEFIAYEKDRKSTRLNSSHLGISYAVFCLKKKKNKQIYEHQQDENKNIYDSSI